jgi:hypothetical protein
MKRYAGLIGLFVLFFAVGCADEGPVGPIIPTDDYAALVAEMEALEADLEGGGSGKVVVVPPGSNALASAIAEAGPEGTVLLSPGLHTESGTVLITHRVRIVGNPGAILEVDTNAWGPDHGDYFEPALHVLGTSRVVIWGVEIRPTTDPGGVAILVENSPHTVVGKTNLYGHQFGVIVHGGDSSRVWKNTVVATDIRWPDSFTPINLVVSVGGHVKLAENDVSNGISGIFVSDEKGSMWGNEIHNNDFAGVILCNLLPMPGPGSTIIQAEFPATGWTVERNNAHKNATGYLLLDGANNNLLVNNAASNNVGLHDIDLFGANGSQPSSFENRVDAGSYKDLTIQDCGVDNTVSGGNQVPCS